jgi:hypothetical protein
MQALGGQYMRADQRDQRRQCRRAGADPIGQGRDVKIDAFPGIHVALAVERLVLGEPGIEDYGRPRGGVTLFKETRALRGAE